MNYITIGLKSNKQLPVLLFVQMKEIKRENDRKKKHCLMTHQLENNG